MNNYIRILVPDIQPNFTRNRYDLIYKKNVFLIEYTIDSTCHHFYAYKKGRTILLGIYLMKFNKKYFENLIELIFKNFNNIDRIKILSSVNNYKNILLEKNIDYVTYLPNDKESYTKSLSAQWRYYIKRKWKKLNENFNNIEIKKYSKEYIPDEVFKQYFKYKKLTHKKNYFLSASDYKKKYLVSDAYVLLIDNNMQAIVLNSDIENNIYLENVTYNTSFSKYSLGIILLDEMIKDCINNHKNCIFWGTNHDYKKHFSNYSVETYSGYIYKNKQTENRYMFFKKLLKFEFFK